MNAPQVVMIVIMVLGLFVTLKDHGKPRTPENFWWALFGNAVMFGILYWGGFWE